MFQANKAVGNMQVMIKEQESESERKRRELIDRANMFEGEARKYKEEYSRICDILKSKINDTINNTVSARRWLFCFTSVFLLFVKILLLDQNEELKLLFRFIKLLVSSRIKSFWILINNHINKSKCRKFWQAKSM